MAISILEPIHAQVQKDQFEISWRASENYNGKDNLDLVLVLKNTKNKTVQLDRGDIWFNTIFPLVEKKDSKFELSDKNGNLFCIRFADGTQLKAKDSIVMTYASKYPIVNVSTVPNGFYYQDRVDHSKHYNIPLQAAKIKGTAADQNLFWEKLYDKIQARDQASDSKLILPTPKSIQQKKKDNLLYKELFHIVLMKLFTPKSLTSTSLLSSFLELALPKEGRMLS